MWALVFIAALGSSRSDSATIAGRVLNDSGTAVPSVQVFVEDLAVSPECCQRFDSAPTNGQGAFAIEVPAGIYMITAFPPPGLNPARARVDASGGNITGLDLTIGAGPFEFVPDEPPRASLVDVSPADDQGLVTVSGSPGAVGPNHEAVLVVLDTGHVAITPASADGSFDTTLFAPAGTSILVKSDPIGLVARNVVLETLQGGEGAPGVLSGTIVHVSDPPVDSGIPFAGAGYMPNLFRLQGSIAKTLFQPGEVLAADVVLTIESQGFDAVGEVSASVHLKLERVAGPDGLGSQLKNLFQSVFLTPTDLAFERGSFGDGQDLLGFAAFDLPDVSERQATGSFHVELPLPLDLPSGYYRPRLRFFPESEFPVPDHSGTIVVDKLERRGRNEAYLPIIRIGEPAAPRLFWTLLSDEFSAGSRGIAAIEDQGRYRMSSRIVTDSDIFIVPMNESRSGQPIRYRLEPFCPMISIGDRGIPPAPELIPLRFPSGNLTMTLTKPSGAVITAGPAPFVQARMRTAVSRSGRLFDEGGGHLTGTYQLSTLDPQFEIEFNEYGLHLVTLAGEVEDLWGNVWSGGGTYELWVARPLSLDTTIPGTPYEVGDVVSAGLTVSPPVGADIQISIRHTPGSDRAAALEQVFRGRANRLGMYQPSVVADPFTEPGEYRVDAVANWIDEDGTLWMGSKTWGGVVARPDSPIIAHGKRGTDVQTTPRLAWFLRNQTDSPLGPSHVFLPYHSGDVTWQVESDSMLPDISIQDPVLTVTDLLRDRATRGGQGNDFERQVQEGEIDLHSSRAEAIDPHIDPTRTDLWAYSYRSIQRPMVRVREEIGEQSAVTTYWRYEEYYANQLGNGANGDLPNDFKFQFAGAVLRGQALPNPEYAIYGSLFVQVPEDDPSGTRTMPPFQGAAGGPSGGPIMTIKGNEIDLFFHPTGVRPGTILERGDQASFSGQIGPTLPAKVEITLTAPSGQVRTIAGQANKVGYFYDPAQDFAIDEPGVWTASVNVWFDGLTSAGQVSEPFPSGDVLGSREGAFWFYGVEPIAEPLALEVSSDALSQSPAGIRLVRPAESPVTVTVAPPEALTQAELHYTTVMPGFVLEEGRLTLPVASPGSGFTYTYDAVALHQDFPNLDLFDADGFAGVDAITISFLVSGQDATGAIRHFPRQIVIQGEQLMMPEQQPDQVTINPGLNGAWFNAATPGQGYFMEVFPDIRQLFLAWFTYDTSLAKARVGDDQHRWLTAQGPFDGNVANLDVFLTAGGLFDDPAAVTNTAEGSIIVTFADCTLGRVAYNLTAANLSGSVPIGRLANDNVGLCQDMNGIPGKTTAGPTRDMKNTPPSNRVVEAGKGSSDFQINPGLSGAWFNPATTGQGYLLEVFPDINLVFLSWFTYDTSPPDAGAAARVGDPGHRWLTAQGSFTGDTATLEVFLTTGGLFDDPAPVINTPEGTITVTFQDCTAGTLDYNLTAAGLAGRVPISRLANDNVGLCQSLDGVNLAAQ